MTNLKTVDIKGKAYVMVNERIKHFRSTQCYENWGLITEIIELTDNRCVIKASIINEKNEVKATGLAYEMANNSSINKTSFIENCETSAWGRALANLGIGIDASMASADEVATAINNQTKEESSVATQQKGNSSVYRESYPPYEKVSKKGYMEKMKASTNIDDLKSAYIKAAKWGTKQTDKDELLAQFELFKDIKKRELDEKKVQLNKETNMDIPQ